MHGQAEAAQNSASAHAETGMPVMESYTAKEFKGTQIWSILQDRRGLTYFGDSDSGFLEFDGVNWRKIFTPSAVVRSLAMDSNGTVWVGTSGNFGYLGPDSTGTLQFISLLDKIPVEDRSFTDVWQALTTPQGVFFRSFEELFRWDGKRMQVWTTGPKSRFEALSAVRGHVYTSQAGIGLEEIAGDDLHPVPGGDAYRDYAKLFLYPYDDTRILVSSRDHLLTLYDGQKVTPFPTQADTYMKEHRTYVSAALADGGFCVTTLTGGAVILEHDGRVRQIIDEAGGLPGSGVYSAFQDRDGALWLGQETSITRVDLNSPISIFLRTTSLDSIRFQGSIYASSVGSSAVARMVSDPQTGRPSFVPIKESQPS